MNTGIVDLFVKIVKIDSPSGEEELMGKFLSGWLKSVGFEARTDRIGNLFGTLRQKPQLLLCAHMDTVSPGKSIKPKVVGGIIKSDGSTILGADNKAAIAAIVMAVEEYKRKKGKLPPIEILFSAKEETGGGVEFFPFHWIKSKYAVTFDYAKPLGSIVLAAPYIYNFRIKFVGKSAHASRPDKGVNALVVAAKFLNLVSVGVFDKGETTINVGKVCGGSGINVIPDEVTVEGEVRSTNQKKFKQYLDNIKTLVEQSTEGTKVKTEYKLDGYCSGYIYGKNDLLVNMVGKAIRSVGLEAKYDVSRGVSDVNSLVGAGIKAVCVSDGVRNPHTKKESILVEDLVKLQELVLRTIEEFCLV